MRTPTPRKAGYAGELMTRWPADAAGGGRSARRVRRQDPRPVRARIEAVGRIAASYAGRPLWYRRTVAIPAEWAAQRVLLRFGAVDFDAAILVNRAIANLPADDIARINAACNFGRRLKTLKGLTPYEAICKAWQNEPARFTSNPHHQIPGSNTWS